jgi:WD40 repeat protein
MTFMWFALAVQDPYRVEEGKDPVLRTLHIPGSPMALAVSPDGATLAIGADADLLVVEFETGKLRRTIPTMGGMVRGLAFSPDGSKIAAAMTGGIGLFDLEGKLLWQAKGHPSPLDKERGAAYGAAFSSDGGQLLTISRDEPKLRCWSSKDGTAGTTVDLGLKEPGRIATAAGRLAVTNNHGGFVVLDKDLKELWRNEGSGIVPGIAFSSDGRRLAVGHSQGGCRVEARDAATGDTLLTFSPAGEGTVAGMAWLPDGKRILSASTRSGGVQIWTWYNEDEEEQPPPRILDEKFQASDDVDQPVVLGLKGTAVAVAGSGGIVRLYRLPK